MECPAVADLGGEFFRLDAGRSSSEWLGVRTLAFARLSHELHERLIVGTKPDFSLCSADSDSPRTGDALSDSTGKLGAPITSSSGVWDCVLDRPHNFAWYNALRGLGCQSWGVRLCRVEFTDTYVCDQVADIQEFVFLECGG